MRSFLGIICSPRKPSNSELFLKAVCKELGSDWHLSLIRLIEWDIRPCRACYRCLFESCQQQDDMSELIEQIASADVVAIATPTYFLGATATLKRFIDRGLMFYSHLDRLWGKPMVAVVTAGIREKEGYAQLMAESAVRVMGGKLFASLVAYGAFPGEGVIGTENKEKITSIANALTSGIPLPQPLRPKCPLCGGSFLRFVDEKTVHCLLCSNMGNYSADNGTLNITIRPGEHQLFLSYESAHQHADWLRSMKQKFLTLRDQLKPVARDLANYGTTLKPPSKSSS